MPNPATRMSDAEWEDLYTKFRFWRWQKLCEAALETCQSWRTLAQSRVDSHDCDRRVVLAYLNGVILGVALMGALATWLH